MENTYKWVISALECYPEHEGRTDVVFTVHWRRQATDGLGHVGDVFGTQIVSLDPDSPFTAYAHLTQEQVEGWLEAEIGAERISALDAELAQQILDQIEPPAVCIPLPWAE